jgi:hypothetical protein
MSCGAAEAIILATRALDNRRRRSFNIVFSVENEVRAESLQRAAFLLNLLEGSFEKTSFTKTPGGEVSTILVARTIPLAEADHSPAAYRRRE